MNWYVERNGVSEGPVEEADLAGRVRRAEISAESLIWHPGLEEWKSVSELRPDWLIAQVVAKTTAMAASEANKDVPPPRPATRPMAPSAKPAEEEKQGLFKRLFGGKKKK